MAIDDTHRFELVSPYKPTGDQPAAIAKILKGVEEGKKVQVVLGATGTGKTFTDANIIAALNRPTLVLVHNKTLASQLYGEFKELFPHNRVEYFVSNFDFYQPEAYIPKTDTYIAKDAMMNDEIEMMRTSAVNSIIERRDTIVVASVAAIYGLTDPEEYRGLVFEVRVGETLDRKRFFDKLVEAQYSRNNFDLAPGNFRVHGDIIDICPMYTSDYYIRIDCFGDDVEKICEVDKLSGEVHKSYLTFPIYPAYDHASTRKRIEEACVTISEELEDRLKYFRSEGKLLEAERLEMRTRQDMESLKIPVSTFSTSNSRDRFISNTIMNIMMPSIPMPPSKLVELSKNPLQKPRQTTKTRNKRGIYERVSRIKARSPEYWETCFATRWFSLTLIS